jgi:hypothetical protein
MMVKLIIIFDTFLRVFFLNSLSVSLANLNLITMNDYLFEPGKTLRFEFSFGDQLYTARVSPGLIKSNGTKFFHARWWIKEIENSSLSVGADFTPRKSEKSDIVTWTIFPSGIAKDETDCVQAAMIMRLEEAGYDLFR